MVQAGVTCRTRSKAAHLVTTITHPETTEVANHLIGQGDNVLTAELVHPEELMSGLLSQVRCCCLCAHNLEPMLVHLKASKLPTMVSASCSILNRKPSRNLH